VADLGNFPDTRYHPRPWLAFDLIARDAATAEKLLPGMLNDPSVELRRDAVEQVITYAIGCLLTATKSGRPCCISRR
jgi:hypothetical protein